MTRIIQFTGVQGSGKTTMRKLLTQYLEHMNATVLDQYLGVKESISRDAAELGFTLNESTNFETQYYLAVRYIMLDLELRKYASIIEADYIIVDRSPLDVIPYAMTADIDFEDKKYIKNMLLTHFHNYPADLVYCVPLKKIEEDGTRSVSKQFQDEIDLEFANTLDYISQWSNYITLGVAPIEQRFEYLRGVLQL